MNETKKMTFDEYVGKAMELRRIQGENKMNHEAIMEGLRHGLDTATEQATQEYKAKLQELRKGYREEKLREVERYRQEHIATEMEQMRVKNEWEMQQKAEEIS